MPKKIYSWRVEASVPAIQWVEASTKEEAIKKAVEKPDGWDVDVTASIEEEHIVDVEQEEEVDE